MSTTIKIKKGKDIPLVGRASTQVSKLETAATYAIKPTDFKGITPKLSVKEGDEVKAGSVLFYDKANPDVKFVSPVSGEVAEIKRGARRAILEVRILADKNMNSVSHSVSGWENFNSEQVKELILASGLWPCLTQRPFGYVADTESEPKAIFISGYDSAPLGVDYSIVLEGKEDAFKTGIQVLNKLAPAVHLGVKKGSNTSAFKGTEANVTEYEGPHPAGLVGIHIHHKDPINKGDVVWTIEPQCVVWLGELFTSGELNPSMRIALAGEGVSDPQYLEVINGASIKSITDGRLNDGNFRIISGDVLTGDKLDDEGYIGFGERLISVIPEGDHFEFLGWLFPTYRRPTISNSLPLSKFFTKEFKVNTNYHGEERAFVMTGQYDKVLPMDILAVPLLKAILAQDLEAMENLGIYEIIEEDLALCEFVCTSKIEVQNIVREGLELIAEEG